MSWLTLGQEYDTETGEPLDDGSAGEVLYTPNDDAPAADQDPRTLVLPRWTASGSGAPTRVSPLVSNWNFPQLNLPRVERRAAIPTWAVVAAGAVAFAGLIYFATKD